MEAALAHAETSVAGLVGLGLDRCSDSDTDILTLWRRLEALSRQLASVDHGLIGQAQARPPVFPYVAAAAAGTISPRQVHIIVSTVERLPDRVQAESGEHIEHELVGYATRFDADDLGKLARRYRAVLDPDGLLREVDYRHRHRALNLRKNDDGSAQLSGELTAEATAWMDSIFDSLAKPRARRRNAATTHSWKRSNSPKAPNWCGATSLDNPVPFVPWSWPRLGTNTAWRDA